MSVTAGRVKTMSLRVRLHEYYELCKPRVVMLIVFTAVVGMFLAVPGLPPLAALIWGTLGIGLQAAAAPARRGTCRPPR
jgi:heme o synthase